MAPNFLRLVLFMQRQLKELAAAIPGFRDAQTPQGVLVPVEVELQLAPAAVLGQDTCNCESLSYLVGARESLGRAVYRGKGLGRPGHRGKREGSENYACGQ